MTGGSHSFIDSWLVEQAIEPVKFPTSTVRAVFDNEQKVSKTWKVKVGNKCLSDVITSHAYITIHDDKNLQYQANLSPKFWAFDEITEDKINSSDHMWNDKDFFRKTRDSVLRNRLARLVNNSAEPDIIDSKDIICLLFYNFELGSFSPHKEFILFVYPFCYN